MAPGDQTELPTGVVPAPRKREARGRACSSPDDRVFVVGNDDRDEHSRRRRRRDLLHHRGEGEEGGGCFCFVPSNVLH